MELQLRFEGSICSKASSKVNFMQEGTGGTHLQFAKALVLISPGAQAAQQDHLHTTRKAVLEGALFYRQHK